MKNFLAALLPALSLFALGGCAGSLAYTSSEDDGVYYNSKDRTTAYASQPAPATPTNEADNPDYRSGPTTSPAPRSGGSTQYYDNTYTYMRGVPSYSTYSYYGPGVTYYTPYSPYTTLAYGGGFGYGMGGYGMGGYGMGGYGMGGHGFAPYPCVGAYDPFYSPYYSPFGYGPGISIAFGYGNPYGYGRGFYDPYYYASPYYGGYYGRGGYYGSNYYGNGNRYGNGNGNSGYGYYGNDQSRTRTSGHRSDRYSDGRNLVAAGAGSSGPAPTTTGGGRVRTSDLLGPSSEEPTTPTASESVAGGRTRTEGIAATPDAKPDRADDSFNRPRALDQPERPRNLDERAAGQATPDDFAAPVGDDRDDRRNRGRAAEVQPQPDQMPSDEGRRRSRFQDNSPQPRDNGNQAADDQPRRQREYEQPRQPQNEQPRQREDEQPRQPQNQPQNEQPRQRVYEQPRQRVYEQPQQRSYEQPQRSESQPSYSAPSGGGGGGGGGHSRGRVD